MNIVYSDESGIDDNEVSSNGWAQIGQRCYSQKKAVRKTRYNIIAALNANLLFAPFVFEGYSNKDIYEVYVQRVLVPSLKPGMTVVIDNASFHKSKLIIKLIESAGCKVLFLPPYSPDLNPIEHHWSAIKSAIRKAASMINNFCDAIAYVLESRCIS